MPDARTDAIAREAARLIETGRTDDIAQATRMAANSLGLHGSPLPGAGRVRKHAQAMAMQAMGEAVYLEKRQAMWTVAEEMMSALEHAAPEATSLLTGRAAEGHFDAGVTIHIRLYTRRPMREIVAALVELGYDEAQFKTADTRLGRLDQARFVDEDFDVALVRCLPEALAIKHLDLITSQPIITLTLVELRRVLGE